jgi:hypothetical protein
MAILRESLKRLFKADANPDPIIAEPPAPGAATPAAAAPVAPASVAPAVASAPAAPSPASEGSRPNPGTDFANTQYALINFQYAEDNAQWPKKIGVFKKGAGICWYQVIEPVAK